jgi:hypothetical protein
MQAKKSKKTDTSASRRTNRHSTISRPLAQAVTPVGKKAVTPVTPYIKALPRDPEWIYAFWELPDKAAKKPMLQVFDVTANNKPSAIPVQSIEITGDADNWYIHVPPCGHKYAVELGLSTPGGSFHSVARSNVVALPRAAVSRHTTVEWATPHANIVQQSSPAPLTQEEAAYYEVVRMHPPTTASSRSITTYLSNKRPPAYRTLNPQMLLTPAPITVEYATIAIAPVSSTALVRSLP